MGRVIDRTGIQSACSIAPAGLPFKLLAPKPTGLYTAPRCVAPLKHAQFTSPPGLVIDFIVENGRVLGVELQDHSTARSRCCRGCHRNIFDGLIHTGRRTTTAGRAGEPASIELQKSLSILGFQSDG